LFDWINGQAIGCSESPYRDSRGVCQQRQGFGRILLVDAMYKTLEISKNAGVIGLFVDAKDENAKNYYLQYGFCEFQDNSL